MTEKGQTILLVDDCANDLFMMRIAFERAAFKMAIQEAHDGAEAIAYLRGDGEYGDRLLHPLPALVLLDLNMPLRNGFEVLAWARSQPAFLNLMMVVMAASMRPEDIKKAFDLGATSYLVKPIELSDLTAMVACLRTWIRINHFPPRNELVS